MPWVALAGSRAGAKPWAARDMSRLRPSISARGRSSSPASRASSSTSSLKAVPWGGSRTGCRASSASATRSRRASSWPSGASATRSSEKRGSVSMSGSSTGRFTTAKSSRSRTSSGTSDVVVASTTITSSLGWRRCASSSSRGTSHRAVVPITPVRTVPARSSRSDTRSSWMARSSTWMRRARSATISPSGVRLPLSRSMRRAPTSRSRWATWVDTLDCTVCRARAAAEKLWCSATASRALSWRRSIALNDTCYRFKLFAR